MLRFRRLNREELEQLKIRKGDIVTYDGEQYIVREAGLRYIYLNRLDGTPVPGLFHVRFIRKHHADEVSTSPFDGFDSTVTFDRNSLVKRRS